MDVRCLLITCLALGLVSPLAAQNTGRWPAYGGSPGGDRFSGAEQVNRDNVGRLDVAWIHRTGDLLRGRGRFEATPILVDGTLYLSTPLGRVDALDPATGAERWSFDPGVSLHGDYGDFTNRGVAAWLDAQAPANAPCRRRIFDAPIDGRLIALDAATGLPCPDFGREGTVDLVHDLANPPAWDGEYQVTSPPLVIGDIVVVGSAIADNQRTNAPEGIVRAYDARTGARRWGWDPIPRDRRDPAHRTWGGRSAEHTGGANVWSIMSADPALGLIYVPVGSASPDFYGGERPGDNRYANSVVALHAADGRVAWSFQAVHHDLWDYDIPAQPVLFTLHRDGRAIPALAQATKMGFLYILDRRTGTPLFPVEERPVPASDVPGEHAAATQPFPLNPAPMAPLTLHAEDAFGVTAADRDYCRARIAGLRNEGVFTPPSLQGTLIVPGNIGGSHWGGVSIDTLRGIVVGPTNRLPFVVRVIPRADLDRVRRTDPGPELGRMEGTPYAMQRGVLMSPSRVPCGPPPWGALTAIDLSTGRKRWEVQLGYMPPLAQANPEAKHWGSINLGGALVTAGGLTFIAGTFDLRLRAFDTETGKELWSAPLPAGGHATPMSYSTGGRQYIVVAAGGHDRLRTPLGDYVLAFALPDSSTRPPTTLPLEGTFEGDLRLEEDRYPVRMTFHQVGDSVTGTLVGRDPAMHGTIAGRRTGAGVDFTVAFTVPDRPCSGTMVLATALANNGTLLVGTVHVSGECSGEEPEDGTTGLRRRER
ncbi:MAG: pyrroloquinoline quinone-dependent dehydrogenase [Gemmatimonadales bacterium]